ncbi:hypothetical protein B0H10DRAFT_2046084 [Mycena sp. CBHHK59/15]|nr:hypothetical protein B0H10DRAFT_2046084 [Mycena sp. CBHHK59/15]
MIMGHKTDGVIMLGLTLLPLRASSRRGLFPRTTSNVHTPFRKENEYSAPCGSCPHMDARGPERSAGPDIELGHGLTKIERFYRANRRGNSTKSPAGDSKLIRNIWSDGAKLTADTKRELILAQGCGFEPAAWRYTEDYTAPQCLDLKSIRNLGQ